MGQPGRSARWRGNPKPNPLFRSPAGLEPSGEGNEKGRPGSLLRGRPEGTRRVRPERNGRPGNRVRPMEKSRQDGRRLAGKTSDGRKQGLPCGSLTGDMGACFHETRIGRCRSLLLQNPIGNRPGSRDPGRNPEPPGSLLSWSSTRPGMTPSPHRRGSSDPGQVGADGDISAHFDSGATRSWILMATGGRGRRTVRISARPQHQRVCRT